MPEKEFEKDDCDELGRPKNSLPHILFSLHRSFERRRIIAGTETETIEDEDGSAVDSLTALRANTEVKAGENPSEAIKSSNEDLINPKTINLDGGLLLVSSNPPSFGSSPYMCTFDPAETGKPFCAEVNLGECK